MEERGHLGAEQIPDEVVYKLHDKLWGSSQFSVEEGRAAIAAALNAWPGIQDAWYEGNTPTAYLLPLPTKETDA